MSEPQPDNPFAYRRKSLQINTLWPVALVAVIVAVALSPQIINRVLLGQLTADLDSLPSDTQIDRLAAIGQLGPAGVPVLVSTLAESDPDAADAAFQVLQSMQASAISADDSDIVVLHQKIVDEVVRKFDSIPSSRYSWLRKLVNRTLLETLKIESEPGRACHQSATALLARISVEPQSSGQTETIASRGADPVVRPRRLVIDTGTNVEPLNSQSTAAIPPIRENAFDESTWVDPIATRIDPSPTKPGGPLEPEMLTNSQSNEPERLQQTITAEANIISSGGYAGNYPLEAYSTRAVIDLLSSVRKPLASMAQSELTRRGFSAAELRLAMRLASTSALVRLDLVDEIPRRDDVDPRKWLLWLAEDSERSIRLEALSALGTMDDPNVKTQLRTLLSTEQDTAVANRIRQALLR